MDVASCGQGRFALRAVAIAVLVLAEMSAGETNAADPPPGTDSAKTTQAASPTDQPAKPAATPEAASPPPDSTTSGPQAAKPETAPAATNLAPVQPDEAIAILGKKVRGPDGKDVMGPVIDVLVDGDGHPRAAIIDFGGFLGVGSRKIAVDWQSLKFRPADHDDPLILSLDRAQIQAAPEYKEATQPAQVVEPPAPAAPPIPPDAGNQSH
jgi:hypothetical protein